jgi:filamentous hemagglutinin family protein
MKNFKSFLTLAFCSIFFHSLISNQATEAQVAVDGSLPTKVNQSEQTTEITGGAEAGNNLFHSFEEFSVPTGQTAFFNNAPNITNIFSRITGNSVSEIDGLIRANGNANLFLLNPNGIIFGQNAALDIGGSFVATSAESLVFEDGTVFDTQNPQNPLLTISIPIGLQVGSEAGSITNQSKVTNNAGEVVGLEVNPGQNFTLVGGDINLNGGNITAPGGQVNLGGVTEPGTVNFADSQLRFENPKSLANVSLDNQAEVNVRSDDNGEIAVNAKNLSLTGDSNLLAGIAEGLGSTESRAGDIKLNISETLSLRDASQISNTLREQSVGTGGNVNIDTSFLFLASGSGIASSNLGTGNAGNINVKATNSISIDGSIIQADNYSLGDAGNINVKATNSISIIDSSIIQADTYRLGNAGDINLESASGTISFAGVQTGVSTAVQRGAVGQGGDISITARNLTLTTNGDSNQVGATLQTTTLSQGDAGNITIRVDDTISFDGATSGAFTRVIGEAVGQGGDIDIQARSLSITNGASILAGTFGQGDAGNINITASDSLVISGTAPFPTLADANGSPGGFSSLLYTATDEGAGGQGGDINIDTNSLQVTDGGVLSGRSRSEFPGGNITVNANTLELAGGGQILTTAFAQGTAGNITLNVSDNINISGSDPQFTNRLNSVTQEFGKAEAEFLIDSVGADSGVYANTRPSSTGDSGSITLNAGQLNISDNGKIFVTNQGNSDGGNIAIQAQDRLTLRNNSQISATAGIEGAGGDGGNITIDTDFLIASPLENIDIVANAFEGDGGNISIAAQSIFGIEQRTASDGNRTNDIDASSEFGLSGTVEINTPDVDPNQDLVQLPTQPTEKEVVQACAPSNVREQSEFVIKGSGGLPPSPEDALDSDALEVDWVSRQHIQNNSSNSSEINNSVSNSVSSKPTPIIEAQKWIVDDNNDLVLVADNPINTWQNFPQCQKKVQGQFNSWHLKQNLDRSHSLLTKDSEQNILIASTEPQSSLTKVPERINVDRFEVKGNKAFSSEKLAEVLAPFTGKPLSFSELLQARSAITKYYTERGYITSGAYIPPQKLQNKVVKIQIVEGYLEDIEITGNRRLNSDYFKDRLERVSNSLQQEELLAALQLLQQDPLIANISAELEAGTSPGANVLTVEVKEADSFKTPILLDNRRTPSVGSFRRQLAIAQGNLLGFGDKLFLAYSNTEGSNAFDGSYTFPLNARNSTLTLSGGVSESEVVEEPFNQLNILGDSHYYELSLRQPLIQTPTQEFALGITASRRESDISSLLEEFDVSPSELSPGADESGQTQVSVLRFFQEWTNRNSREVLAARSQFNLGLGVFDATVNEDAPDSRFLAWQGQAQWTRQLASDTLFLIRGGIQLSTTSLLSSEQLGLGGLETVRGYRQDVLLTDNAAFASAEIRLPVLRIDQINSVLQLAPFFDVGTAWNNGKQKDSIEPNTLASIGLGLRLLFNSFTARLDWGIPLISVDSDKKTWQENGLYFSVEYSPF